MSERKPNNLPWIVLGSLCGVAVLGLFAFGVYSGATTFSDEVSITVPDMSEQDELSAAKNTSTIYVNALDEIFYEGTRVTDLAALEGILHLKYEVGLENSIFILRMSEDASHKSLVSIKDKLDGLGANSRIEIVRATSE